MNLTKNQIIVLAVGVSIFLILILTGALPGLKQTSGRILTAALNFNPPTDALFNNTDNFVLFADKEISLAQDVQVSSGDLGSNGKLDIQKENIINGNLFAKEIIIDKDTTINGNASYNKLKFHKDSRILGVTSSPVSLPVAELPEIPDFQIGSQDFKFTGQNNVLNPGSYRNILIEKDSRLILTGGIYNLRKLELKENSTLIYNSPTTVNIQSEFKTRQHIAILPGNNNLSATDLTVNYLGEKDEEDEDDKNDDEEDENGENGNEDNDDKDKKSNSRFQNFRERFSRFFQKLFGLLKKAKDRKDNGVKPIQFGNDSFLNFKLLAPKANVKLGERTTLRGQVLGREIKVGKESVLARDIVTSLRPQPEDIIETIEGERFVVNQIILQLTPDGTFFDATTITDSINGRIVGIVPSINLYQINVSIVTIEDLDNIIQQLITQQNPKIKKVAKNVIINLIQ